MDVTIVDATGNRTEEASVPGNTESDRIAAKLVKLMELPSHGPDGQPLSYRLHHKQSGRTVAPDETLEQAGVHDGDVLRLVAEITAGGSDLTSDAGSRPVRVESATAAARASADEISRLRF